MSSSRQTTLFQSWGKSDDTSSVAQVDHSDFEDLPEDDALLLAACQEFESAESETSHVEDQPTTSTSKRTGAVPLFRANQQGSNSVPCPGPNGFAPRAQSVNQQPFPPLPPQGTALEDLPGFDVSAGDIWIYPTNYPVRDYQFNIVQQALFKNTMVTLPTGLGKTFIAAVVMYNFYRWYPQGKVIFMAPTKPLVAQQIEACFNIMGIPQTHMAEMTGNMAPVERKKCWFKKRVFFLTPQVLMNDLSRRACPAEEIKCLVVDEAHKALGNHAYCQVVKELSKYTIEFRVLALSATPGGDLKAVQQVLSNMLVAHIEIRSEDAIDIRQYVHERKVEKVVVPLGEELKYIRDQYLQVLMVYTQRLIRCGVLYKKDPASLTKFEILRMREGFRQDPPQQVTSSMGTMSAENEDTTRPPEVLEPYAETNVHRSSLTVRLAHKKVDKVAQDNTNCNNDDPSSVISEDHTSSSIDAFSSSCEADLEVSIHITESPYETVDRKWRESAMRRSYLGETENTNQSNQADSDLLNLPEGTDSVINPGYSSIDRYRVNNTPSKHKSTSAVLINGIKIESVQNRTPENAELKARTDNSASPKPREINANNIVLPGKAIRVNSVDGRSSVGSSNSSVNLIRQGSNCSDFSINTSRTRLIKKDRVKWGTLDHRKLEEVTPSKFVNGRFENPWDTWQEASFGRICRWFCSSEHRNIPSQAELDGTLPILKPNLRDINRPPRNGIRMTWLGHATCLVQFDGITILTDPVFSERCGPVPWLGKKRYRKAPLTVHELPKIDAVVISHSHFDHLDAPSVHALNTWFGSDLRWFIPLGLMEWFTSMGCENVIELDWWQENCIPTHSEITFAFTPSQHWARRTITDTNKSLWGSWCIMGPNHSFFFAGDTGYCKGFKEIGKRYGPFDLAAIPVGAYEPRWFKKPMHTDPTDAVQIHQDVLAKKSVGIHWGTFRLGNEFYLDPPQQLTEAMRAKTLSEDDFFTLKHGEVKHVVSE